jgi:hypothetical protein
LRGFLSDDQDAWGVLHVVFAFDRLVGGHIFRVGIVEARPTSIPGHALSPPRDRPNQDEHEDLGNPSNVSSLLIVRGVIIVLPRRLILVGFTAGAAAAAGVSAEDPESWR